MHRLEPAGTATDRPTSRPMVRAHKVAPDTGVSLCVGDPRIGNGSKGIPAISSLREAQIFLRLRGRYMLIGMGSGRRSTSQVLD
jgi:hypothetical protein